MSPLLVPLKALEPFCVGFPFEKEGYSLPVSQGRQTQNTVNKDVFGMFAME